MNFNLVALLFAACASFAAALTTGQQEKLAMAPPVRHSKHSKYTTKSSSHKPLHRKGSSISSSSLSKPSLSPLQSASESHNQSKACSRRLEAILYSPPSTVKEYLAKISLEMRTDIQVIMAAFAGGNLEYLRTYVNKYKILITVAAPFGLPVIVTPTLIAETVPLQNVAFAQTLAGRDGFYADSTFDYYNYQFSMMSSNGQYITFILSLPLSAMTNSPKNC